MLSTEPYLELMIGVREGVQCELGSLPWGWTAWGCFTLFLFVAVGSRLIVYISGGYTSLRVSVSVSFQPCTLQARGSQLSLGTTYVLKSSLGLKGSLPALGQFSPGFWRWAEKARPLKG